MKAKGQMRSQINLLDKETGETVGHYGRTNRVFNTHLLCPDDDSPKTKVGFSSFMRQGVDYSSLVIGCEAWVELTCDQDDKMIARAQRLSSDLAQFEVERHEKNFEATLDAYWEENPDRVKK